MDGSPRVDETRRREFHFGEFVLDLDGGFLHRGGEEVPLRPKSFDALTYLVERHGRLVTKTELIEALWPDAAVTDNSLAQCLLDIRRVLGDDSQKIIRTVARRGYVFALPVTVMTSDRGSIGVPERKIVPLAVVRRTSGLTLTGRVVGAVIAVIALTLAGIGALRFRNSERDVLTYTQLTNFTDSAVAPALSPDGRMLAFIRGGQSFYTSAQIYVKLLPNGEAVQVTHDPRAKYGLAFSPDGSKIAYTVAATPAKGPDSTYTISPLGGEPALLLANASGLTWLDERRLLFSEIKTGMHMGVVTAGPNRSDQREVYFPEHERAMAHYSFASPDRRWALVIEMDYRPMWQPCRLVPLDGTSPGRPVGPPGWCTGAGWSPDGAWMYFTVAVDEKHHLWRQRFPNGEPEQLTSGAEQEDGLAVAPDGSLVTSIGAAQSALWIHDSHGDHPASSEGDVVVRLGSVSFPSFSADGTQVTDLRSETPGSPTVLWRTDIESGRSEPVLPGVTMTEYDISPDGKEVVFTTAPDGKPTQLWVAPADASSPPKRIANTGENSPHFGTGGQVLFRFSDGKFNYLGRMNKDGSDRSKVVEYPISTIQNISRDRRWVIAIAPVFAAGETVSSMAIPTAGGSPRRICQGVCGSAAWSPAGDYLYVNSASPSGTSPGKMVVLPVLPDTGLPDLPEAGIIPAEALSIRGSRVVEQVNRVPGPDLLTYAYVKTTVHRNLFRISLP